MIFYLIPLQDLVVSFLFRSPIPPLFLKFLLVLKEVLIILLALLIVNRGRMKATQLIACFMLLFCFPYIFLSEMSIWESLGGLRTYLLFTFSFLVGFELASDAQAFPFFVRAITPLFWFIVVFSFLEYFLLPASIWKTVFPIMEMKRVVGGIAVTNEYYQTGMPVNAFGELLRRLLGPFDEPLYTAYFMMILVNVLFAGSILKIGVGNFHVFLGLIAVVMTQTRAIVIGALLSAFAFAFKRKKLSIKVIYVGLAFSLALAVSTVVFWDFYVAFVSSVFSKTGRNVGHLLAYIEGVKILLSHPFGLGLGTSSTLYSGVASNASTENAFINIAIETGIIGLILFGGLLVVATARFHMYLSRNRQAFKTSAYAVVTMAYLLSIQFIFAGLVAPHILTARIVIPFMIIVGWAYAATCQKS